jgi:hypothetical protein
VHAADAVLLATADAVATKTLELTGDTKPAESALCNVTPSEHNPRLKVDVERRARSQKQLLNGC